MPSVTSDGSVITTLGDKNDRLGASCDAQAIVKVYSRWESNPNLRFRKPPFYPLNYRSIKKPAGLRFGTTGASRFVVFFTKN